MSSITMKGQNTSWKRYSSCVTLNHCLLTFLIVISCVNYSHGFWDWVPFWPSETDEWQTVTCHPNEFKCPSKRLCVNILKNDFVCDGINDCGDGSDELPCPNIVSIMDRPLYCEKGECPRSYEHDPSLPRCAEWHVMNKVCRHQEGKVPLIVFSTLNALYETSLPEDRSKIHVNKTLQFDFRGISAFDYDNFDDLFIWLDESENKIFWGTFVQSVLTGNIRILGHKDYINGTHKIRGFVYDWVNQAAIWSDDFEIRSKRLYYEMDQPKLYRTFDLDYDAPGPMTIDVNKRCIFWMNIRAKSRRWFSFGDRYIERIDISGEPRTEKIAGNIWYPVGLAIDTKNTKVYWIDGYGGTLNSVGYDGTNRITLYRSLSISYQVISMDIFSNYLYLTDWARRKIQRININNAVSKVDTLVSVPDGPPTCVKIIDPRVQFSIFYPDLKVSTTSNAA